MKSLYFSWRTKAYCSLVGLELGTSSVAPTPLKGRGGLDMQFEEVGKGEYWRVDELPPPPPCLPN